jgi:hypothetical protein
VEKHVWKSQCCQDFVVNQQIAFHENGRRGQGDRLNYTICERRDYEIDINKEDHCWSGSGSCGLECFFHVALNLSFSQS